MVKIKGADAADKKNIEAARKSVTLNEDTPEAKRTLPAKKAAAAEQFAKADKRADPADNETPEETTARMAVRGF